MRCSGGEAGAQELGPVLAGALMTWLTHGTSCQDPRRTSPVMPRRTSPVMPRRTSPVGPRRTSESLSPVNGHGGPLLPGSSPPVNGRRTVPPGSAHSKRQLFHHLMSSPPPGGGQFGSKTSPDGGNVHKCATPRLVREIGRHRHPGDTGYIFKNKCDYNSLFRLRLRVFPSAE